MGSHNHAFPQADAQYACLRVTRRTYATLDSALSGSPDTLRTLPDGIGLNTTLQATCEPMGCHIIFVIIVIVIIGSIINYKYYHNIQTSFGLGVKS